MENLKNDRPIAFLDLETTGLVPSSARIVELCVLKVHPDGRQELLASRIDPEVPIPPESTRVHGITDADVAGKPTFAQYAAQLKEFLRGCDVAGFGLRRFDLAVLDAEFRRASVEFSRKGRRVLDAQVIYHRLDPRDLSAAYRKYCGKELAGAHSAEADVRASLEVLDSQLAAHPELPRDAVGLHGFCNPEEASWVDAEGKLVWADGKAVFDFGQYRGRSIEEVATADPGYLEWIAGANFSPEVQEIALRALRGLFPGAEASSGPGTRVQGALGLFGDSG